MTLLAYDGKVLATDTGVWIGDATHRYAVKSAFGRGYLVGVSGNAAKSNGYLQWVLGLTEDCPVPEYIADGSDFIAMRISVHKPEIVELVTSTGIESYRVPYFALGPSAQCALGVLWHGGSAVDAVRASIEHGSCAMGDIRTIDLFGNEAVFDGQSPRRRTP